MKQHRGFTLIETLIYIALFALLIGGGVGSAYSLIESSDRVGVQAMLEEEGNFLLAKIRWSLAQPGAVISVNAEGEMILTQGGVPTPLSNTAVVVSGFAIDSSDMQKITYAFSLSTKTGGGQETREEFTGTHYVRQ